MSAGVGAGWDAGDTIWAAVEFECDAGAAVNGSLYCEVYFRGPSGAAVDNFRAGSDPAITYVPQARAGAFLTPSVVIPPGTTRLQFIVGGNISGTWRFGRATMRVNEPLSRTTTIALFGDSITAANWNAAIAPSGGKASRGYFTWANILAGQRAEVIANAGVGGNETHDMLARIGADVIAHDPDWCVVQGGANDCAKGGSYATIVANLEAIYDSLAAASVSIIATTITPSTSIAGFEQTVREDVNDWIRSYCTVNAIPLCDWSSAVEDRDGAPLAGTTVDGVHPSGDGAAKLGEVLAAVIIDELAADSPLPGTDSETGELLSNGFFMATAGTVAPTVISPNGGERWTAGFAHNIAWQTGNGGKVTIELSRNNGASWETLYASTANDGSQSWTVRGSAATEARVRVTNAYGIDGSDEPFTILASPIDTTPRPPRPAASTPPGTIIR